MIVKLSKDNFEKKIESGLKIVEFFAPWCGYCKRQEPILEELTKIWIGQVNADESPELTQKYKVNSFPTFLIFRDGKEIEKFSGLHSKFEIMEILTKYLKN